MFDWKSCAIARSKPMVSRRSRRRDGAAIIPGVCLCKLAAIYPALPSGAIKITHAQTVRRKNRLPFHEN